MRRRTAAEVVVLIPGLAGPEASGEPREAAGLLLAELRVDGLAQLLGRARAQAPALAADTVAGMVWESLGGAGAVPAGALSRHAFADDAGAGVWIRADPVHLRADLGKLIVFPPRALGLDQDEASSIAQWLSVHPLHPGPRVEAVTPRCWTARLERLPALRSVAPDAAQGRDAQDCMPVGDDAAAWHARMNEIQMLLHECPRNAERESEGRPAVNSLWFWGAGPLPPRAACDVAGLWGDDPVLRGAARWCGAAGGALPDDPDRWCASLACGRHLLALDELSCPAGNADVAGWREALQTLDRDWLQPLARALDTGRVRVLELHAGGGAGARLTRRAQRRWWRRRDPVGGLARLRGQGSR